MEGKQINSVKKTEQCKKKPKYVININTWSRSTDSHGLYDYQEQLDKLYHKQYELPINIPTFYIFRNKKSRVSLILANECIIKKQIPKNYQTTQKNDIKLQLLTKIQINFNLTTKKLLLTFVSNQKLQSIYGGKTQEKENNNKKINIVKDIPGIVVSQQKDKEGNAKGYLLKIGMVIYFGKVRYIVREIKKDKEVVTLNKNIRKIQEKIQEINNQQSKEMKYQIQEKLEQQKEQGDRQPTIVSQDSIQKQNQKQQQKVFCRVCYDTSSLVQNRLINLCECIGSCKFIHVQCLRNWLDMKSVTTIRQHCISMQKINCQICKTELPMSININGFDQQVALMQRPKDCDYLMLQKLQLNSRNILILKNLPSEGLSIGRGGSCYIKVIDNTISRKPHAFIQYKSGNFYIFDNKSKFGTLVVEEPLQIEVGKNKKKIQIGRTIISFLVRKDQRILTEI